MSLPLSVLIRTFNSAGMLEAVLTRLRPAPGDEIIIVDSGSTDATLEIARRHGARIVTAPPPFNYSKSLNLGFQAANNPWVLVLSSHCLPLSEDLLAVFREAAAHFPETVDVAYGDCSLVAQPDEAGTEIRFMDRTSPPAQREQVYGGNVLALYRRPAWAQQRFDESLPTGEDMDWLLRAFERGATAARVPAARVLYRNQGSLRHMFRKGWLESRALIRLTGVSGLSARQFAVFWGSLLKKWVTGKIPLSALLRQMAHVLGAFCSPRFARRKPNP